jgi:hypothetical protein
MICHYHWKQHDVYYPSMGVVFACALSFMSKYLHQSCGPKPMTRVDINDNNQSSNTVVGGKSLLRTSTKGLIMHAENDHLKASTFFYSPNTKPHIHAIQRCKQD